jgi:membrane fusion protein, adhesin transport system
MRQKDAPLTEEDEFVFTAINEEDNSRLGRYMLYLIGAALVAALVWASYFELDEVSVAQGKVIPSSRGQVVQVLETGILRSLNVKEGQAVKLGEILLQLDDSRAGPIYRESLEKWRTLLAQEARLRAEAYDMPLVFPPEVMDNESLIRRETQAYNARKNALDDQLVALERSTQTIKREIELTAPLVKQGVVSEVELLRLKRQAAGLDGQIAELRTRYLSTASNELVRVDSELAQVSEILMAHRYALKRTVVHSPTDGIVKDISISTIGAVINSGQVIMEIVPVDDEMLIEAFVAPSEVAFVKVGQPARVKLSAFDSSRYGDLEGVVKLISPDVMIEDVKGGASQDSSSVNFEPGFYKIVVSITNPGIERRGLKLNPRPGMTATVDILTGQKTVLEYIFRPIENLKSALRER